MWCCDRRRIAVTYLKSSWINLPFCHQYEAICVFKHRIGEGRRTPAVMTTKTNLVHERSLSALNRDCFIPSSIRKHWGVIYTDKWTLAFESVVLLCLGPCYPRVCGESCRTLNGRSPGFLLICWLFLFNSVCAVFHVVNYRLIQFYF